MPSFRTGMAAAARVIPGAFQDLPTNDQTLNPWHWIADSFSLKLAAYFE